jgi:hypothetical protein
VTSWAIEGVPNPTVLRVHVDEVLTDLTIVTCPPEVAAMPLGGVLEIEAVRSLDLHRYRARINLRPGVAVGDVRRHVEEILTPTWGAESPLTEDEGPRAFSIDRDGPRLVAESLEMATGHRDDVLVRLLEVDGVVEAIVGEGVVLVRLGRLFGWDEAEARVSVALVP